MSPLQRSSSGTDSAPGFTSRFFAVLLGAGDLLILVWQLYQGTLRIRRRGSNGAKFWPFVNWTKVSLFTEHSSSAAGRESIVQRRVQHRSAWIMGWVSVVHRTAICTSLLVSCTSYEIINVRVALRQYFVDPSSVFDCC